MDELGSYVEGTCKHMCPLNEIKMRERRQILHVLEMVSGTESSKKPKADIKKTVKAFQRSAAGKSMTDKENLRTPDALLYTVHYLLNDVACSTHPWHKKYDFIMDRLRAVRQDMVIQNLSRSCYVALLQPMIRFYAYISYRLTEERINVFDPTLNRVHLLETLKRLLCVYDEYDKISSLDNTKNEVLESRPEFEALYILINIGDETALNRALHLPLIWRTEIVQDAMKASLLYLTRNYIKLTQKIQSLPPLLCTVTSLHMPQIRRFSLKIMAVAYNSTLLKFPLKDIQKMLLYESIEKVKSDCQHYGLEIDGENVIFKKSTWKDNKLPSSTREKFVQNKLRKIDGTSMIYFIVNS